jgi:hypothetical protein
MPMINPAVQLTGVTPVTCGSCSAAGCTVFLGLVGLIFQLQGPASLLIVCLCLFMGFFSVGLGAITFVVASEIFPLAVRVGGSEKREGERRTGDGWSVFPC